MKMPVWKSTLPVDAASHYTILYMEGTLNLYDHWVKKLTMQKYTIEINYV